MTSSARVRPATAPRAPRARSSSSGGSSEGTARCRGSGRRAARSRRPARRARRSMSSGRRSAPSDQHLALPREVVEADVVEPDPLGRPRRAARRTGAESRCDVAQADGTMAGSSSAWVTIPTGFVKSSIQAPGAARRAPPRRCRGRPGPCAAPWQSRPPRWSPGRCGRTCRGPSRRQSAPPCRRPGAGRARTRRRAGGGLVVVVDEAAAEAVGARMRPARPATTPGAPRRCRGARARRPAAGARTAIPSTSSGVYVLPPPITAILIAHRATRRSRRAARRPHRVATVALAYNLIIYSDPPSPVAGGDRGDPGLAARTTDDQGDSPADASLPSRVRPGAAASPGLSRPRVQRSTKASGASASASRRSASSPSATAAASSPCGGRSSELTREGRLERARGRGTFVRRPPVIRDIAARAGFGDEMRARGLAPYAMVVTARAEPSTPAIATALGIEPGAPGPLPRTGPRRRGRSVPARAGPPPGRAIPGTAGRRLHGGVAVRRPRAAVRRRDRAHPRDDLGGGPDRPRGGPAGAACGRGPRSASRGRRRRQTGARSSTAGRSCRPSTPATSSRRAGLAREASSRSSSARRSRQTHWST